MIEKFVRPTEAQSAKLIKLATLRQITDLPATRTERVKAMRRLLDRITRHEAATLIEVLRDAPVAETWRERTRSFREAHDRAAGMPLEDVEWYRVPRPPVTPSNDDKAWAAEIISPLSRRRETAAQIEKWAASLETREDEVWGDVLVGSWE